MIKSCEKLNEQRMKKGLTLLELSKEIGISIATLSRWENGINDITSDNLIIVAKYFKVSAYELLGIKD